MSGVQATHAVFLITQPSLESRNEEGMAAFLVLRGEKYSESQTQANTIKDCLKFSRGLNPATCDFLKYDKSINSFGVCVPVTLS